MAGSNQDTPGAAVPGYLTGHRSALCLTGPTVVKAGPGTLVSVNVLVAGSGAGGAYDCATTAAASATANEIAILPTSIGPLILQFPCLVALTILPGTGQKVSVNYV